jgi:predicted RNA-binding protein YlqC (UPF0109 family)
MQRIKIKPSKLKKIEFDDSYLFFYSSEIVLKVLAHNNFIGRIIGKGGNIINTIKKETDTKFVENIVFVFEKFFLSFYSI